MIEPALSKEQWRYWFNVNHARGPIVRSIAFDFADGAEGVDIPMPLCDLAGVVALCNAALSDDDEGKLTRADVAECSRAGEILSGHGGYGHPLLDLAAKLAALLPPENAG